MKLSALYNVYNALELLPGSIRQIYNFVDTIMLCYSTSGRDGKGYNPENVLKNAFGGDRKIKLIPYNPDLSINSKQDERNKLQFRIDWAKQQGCTHFIQLAEDHFYTTKQFELAKKIIAVHGHECTISKMFTYYKYPTWQLDSMENYFAPFICKLKDDTHVTRNSYAQRLDPSVMIAPVNSVYEFDPSVLVLHHFSMVRNDINNKLQNAASKFRWGPGVIERTLREYDNYSLKNQKGITYFQGRKVIKVEDQFNILDSLKVQ